MKPCPLSRLLFTGLLMLALAALPGCASTRKKTGIRRASETDMPDQSGDTAFQAFQGRLRKAVARRDIATLAPMMAPNFGYSWEPGGEGAGVFDYWNRNNLWPELDLVLREKFVPSGNFMVAPPEATFDPDYKGYRAGLQLVNGGWRFGYFVSAPPASEIPGQ